MTERAGTVLRPYQVEAIEAIEAEWARGESPTAVVLPTGMGKTTIFSALAARWITAHRSRVLVLVHRDELARQAAARVKADAPHLSVGIVKAALDETDRDVVVASVQTIARESRRSRITGVGMIIIDECHHASAESYQAILTHFGVYDQSPFTRVPCVGVTATLERADGRGMGGTFATVAYTRDIMYGIRGRYLADVRGLSVVSEGIDLSRVRKTRGDYNEAQLGHVMGQDIVCMAAADAYLEHAMGEDGLPRTGVLFAPTVESASNMADAFNSTGIATELVTGATPIAERAGIYHRFRTGETRVLANCMVLTEGWDAPWAKVAVIARPTTSGGLYQQMVGRVLRPWQGQTALVLDIVGAARTHKLASMIDMSVWTPAEGETLLEAEDRELEEDWEQGTRAGARPPRGARFEEGGTLGEIDLFAQSDSCWLRTGRGIWFVPGRDQTLFLWPGVGDDGQEVFTLARYQQAGGRPELAGDGFRDLPLETVMGIAERRAIELDRSVAGRKAGWRRRKESPSGPQLGMAARYGIVPDPEITKAELSDLISVAVASERIDPFVR